MAVISSKSNILENERDLNLNPEMDIDKEG